MSRHEDYGEVLSINYMDDGRWRMLYVRDKDGGVGATQILEGRPGVVPGDRVRVYREGDPPKLRFAKISN